MNANFLHINADKSCYMHFPSVHKINASEKITRNKKRTSKKAKIDNSCRKILVGTINIKEVTEAKFLGVIFDSGLDWSIHVSQLIKKLNVASATIKRISHFIPASSYKNIYHNLFECHMAYCISVWGSVKKKLFDQIFTLQKRVLRCLFGDKKRYLDKFSTAARTRPIDKQKLGEDFYRKEHTKPLFTKHNILVAHNLYRYMSINEIGKLVSTESPHLLFKNIHFSNRNRKNLIILPSKSKAHNEALYSTFSFWNHLTKALDMPNPHNMVTNILKYKVKRYLYTTQKSGDPNNWETHNIQ